MKFLWPDIYLHIYRYIHFIPIVYIIIFMFQNAHTDATLACGGKFFPVHKFVLSTCSDYFNDIFEMTLCKNPVIVLKDVDCKNLEYLLDYMYIGEINVRQNDLASLVNVAECLRIKGLAVPDEETEKESTPSSKSINSSKPNVTLPKRQESKRKSTAETLNQEDLSSKVHTSNHQIKSEPLSQDEFDYLNSENDLNINIKAEPVENNTAIPESVSELRSTSMNLPYYSFNEKQPESDRNVQENTLSNLRMETEEQDSDWPLSGIGSSTEPFRNPLPLSHPDHPVAFSSLRQSSSSRSSGMKRLKRKLSHFKTSKSNFNRFNYNKTNYICPHCPYSCHDHSNFKRHVQIHTGEKPYHCPFCKYSTIHSSNLKSHIRNKHSFDPKEQSSSVNYPLPNSNLSLSAVQDTPSVPY
ncbi:UNVERIFIED_CONTAM: hypothetical protein GTU68_053712 [Idotea baltica]|nr:hypothetical protein [Idotea baltica]